MIDFAEIYRKHWVWRVSRRRDFYEMAAGFIADGKPVFDTLEVFEERWRKIKDPRAATLAMMMYEMRGKNKSGRALRFGEAVALWAPSIEAMAIDAGEQSGDIANGLRMAAKLADTQNTIVGTIRKELAYPTFLLLMLGGLLYMLNTAVMPVFEEISPRHKWPVAARMLGFVSDNAHWIALSILLAIVTVMGAFFITRGPWTGEVRAVFDRFVPPWNLYRRISASIIMSSFAAFIKAGVPFSAIITQMSRTASAWEKSHFDLMKARMRRGISDAEAIAGPLFDEQTRWEITIYGGMSGFAQGLESLSARTTKTTISQIQGVMKVLNFLIMLLVAGMIIWVYGSFFSIVMSGRMGA